MEKNNLPPAGTASGGEHNSGYAATACGSPSARSASAQILSVEWSIARVPPPATRCDRPGIGRRTGNRGRLATGRNAVVRSGRRTVPWLSWPDAAPGGIGANRATARKPIRSNSPDASRTAHPGQHPAACQGNRQGRRASIRLRGQRTGRRWRKQLVPLLFPNAVGQISDLLFSRHKKPLFLGVFSHALTIIIII